MMQPCDRYLTSLCIFFIKDGGELQCCDSCPASFHESCVILEVIGRRSRCPHHRCMSCSRDAYAVGGLLFRCSQCPNAYCDDDLPVDAVIIGRCKRMECGGFILPKQACYIHCSKACVEWAAGNEDKVIAEFNAKKEIYF